MMISFCFFGKNDYTANYSSEEWYFFKKSWIIQALIRFVKLLQYLFILVVFNSKFLNFFLFLQIVSLLIEALAWCTMLVLIGVETKVYIFDFRWFVRFGVIYALVGDAVMFNLVLSMKDFYNRFVFCGFLKGSLIG